MWLCQCECGRKAVVAGRRLRNGHTQSCGCLQREESAKALRITATRHGMRNTPEWLAWKNMRDRCSKTSHPSYHRYGGRGIKVCDRWLDFTAFFEDMGVRPGPGSSVDRIDNDGDYEPGNCRWATAKQQARNRSNTKTVKYRGVQVTIVELAERTGVKYSVLHARLKAGWSVTAATTTPVAPRRPRSRDHRSPSGCHRG